MKIRKSVVRKTCTPSCKEGLTPSFSQGLGCLPSQKDSGFNQLRSYIVCHEMKNDKKMALITTWWWLLQNTTLGPKSQNQNTQTFSQRKLESWWDTKWLVDWEKGKLPSPSFKDCQLHRPLTTNKCFLESRDLLLGRYRKDWGSNSVGGVFP